VKRMNTLLHSITNRASFMTEAFNVASPRLEKPQTDYAELRSILRLDDTTTDVFVVGVLHAIELFPYIESLINDAKTYNLADCKTQTVTIQGGEVSPSKFGIPYFNRRLPSLSDLAIRLKFKGTSVIEIAATEGMFEVPFFYETYKTLLHIEWPDTFHLSCGIKLQQHWNSTSNLSIIVPPVVYPYKAAVDAASSWHGTYNMLNAFGLLSKFYAATSQIEKLAYIAAALGKTNTNFNV